jgi:hypothetical protein
MRDPYCPRAPPDTFSNSVDEEYVRYLSHSSHEADSRTAMWFELKKITGNALVSFSLDDASSTAPLTETRIYILL